MVDSDHRRRLSSALPSGHPRTGHGGARAGSPSVPFEEKKGLENFSYERTLVPTPGRPAEPLSTPASAPKTANEQSRASDAGVRRTSAAGSAYADNHLAGGRRRGQTVGMKVVEWDLGPGAALGYSWLAGEHSRNSTIMTTGEVGGALASGAPRPVPGPLRQAPDHDGHGFRVLRPNCQPRGGTVWPRGGGEVSPSISAEHSALADPPLHRREQPDDPRRGAAGRAGLPAGSRPGPRAEPRSRSVRELRTAGPTASASSCRSKLCPATCSLFGKLEVERAAGHARRRRDVAGRRSRAIPRPRLKTSASAAAYTPLARLCAVASGRWQCRAPMWQPKRPERSPAGGHGSFLRNCAENVNGFSMTDANEVLSMAAPRGLYTRVNCLPTTGRHEPWDSGARSPWGPYDGRFADNPWPVFNRD